MSAGRRFPATPSAWRLHVLRLAVPIVLANLTQPILAAVDTAVAGHLPDPAALGGVALGGVLFSFLFWGFGFLRMGTTGLIAQAHGADDRAGLREALLRALLLAAAIGLGLLAVQGPLIASGLTLLGGGEAVQAYAASYAGARIWSAPFALGNYVLLGYLLGRQWVRVGLLLQVWINLINIAAVFVLVYRFDFGVAGIGAATAVAEASGFVLGLGLLWRLREPMPAGTARWPGWRPLLAGAALRRLMMVNRDIFLRTVCLLGCFAWFARAGAQQGELVLAANALLLNFQSFMAYALDGFAHAAETLTGAAVGARDRQALRSAIRMSMGWAVVCSAGFALAYALGGGAIVALLTDQPALREAAAIYLPWAAALPLASVWGFVLDGVFIGATRTRELMQAMVLCAAAFLALALTLQPAFGNHGLWLAFLLFMGLRGLVLWRMLPRLFSSRAGAAGSACG
ncbi:MATE family efflux transporter [Thauera phenolivorans]|uniref:MATE family efflux transporter n=1 Tax=Thauera phenolivorans TaxID=1792543 RepID=UPI00083ADFEA|nr:MATE family efflux transporter [Thauera phenolivorans]